MESPASLIYGNGVVVDNPTPQNVVDAVATVRSRPGNVLLVWSDTGYALRVHVNSAEALYLELLSWKTGVWLECREPNLSVELVVDSVVSLVAGDVNRVKQLTWVEHALPPHQAFQVGDKVYCPGFDGAMETMSVDEARAKMRRTCMIEWILWCVAAPVIVILGLGALSSHSQNADTALVLLGVVGAVTGGMHFVNWRCPACGNALGPFPKRRCQCSWHETSKDCPE